MVKVWNWPNEKEVTVGSCGNSRARTAVALNSEIIRSRESYPIELSEEDLKLEGAFPCLVLLSDIFGGVLRSGTRELLINQHGSI